MYFSYKMCSTFTTVKKTKKWPIVIFFQELDIAGINMLTIFLATTLKKCTPGDNIFLN